MDARWEKLTLLLKNEEFPLPYTLKVIGNNSPAFQEGCLRLMHRFPQLKQTGSRSTSKSLKVSFTFEFTSANAEEIIDVYQAASTMTDILVLL